MVKLNQWLRRRYERNNIWYWGVYKLIVGFNLGSYKEVQYRWVLEVLGAIGERFCVSHVYCPSHMSHRVETVWVWTTSTAAVWRRLSRSVWEVCNIVDDTIKADISALYFRDQSDVFSHTHTRSRICNTYRRQSHV